MLKRFAIFFVVLVLLLVGAALIAPSFIDWNSYKPAIKEQITKATGYDLEIKGDLDLAVLPFPHLKIEDFILSNPQASEMPQILSMEHASVHVALLPLLQKDIKVERVDLVAPRFSIVRAKDGTMNWMNETINKADEKTSQTDSAPSSEGAQDKTSLPAISLDQIVIKKGRFAFDDKGSDKTYIVDDINVSLNAVSLMGPYFAEGSVLYDDQYIKFDLESGAVKTDGEAFALQVNASVPALKTEATYKGLLALADTPELQGAFSFDADNLAALLAFISKADQQNPALQKPLQTKGLVTLKDQALAYKDSALGFGGLNLKGDMQVDLTADNKPSAVAFTYVADTPFDSAAYIATNTAASAGSAKGKNGQAGENASPFPSSFMPSVITLPQDIDVQGVVNLSAVKHGDVVLSDVAVEVYKKAGDMQVDMSAASSGQSKIVLNSELAFGARTVSPQSGEVTYSDPSFAVDVDISADDPSRFVQAVMADKAKDMEHLFIDPFDLTVRNLKIKPKQIDLGRAAMTFLGADYDLGGSFVLRNTERPILNLSLNGVNVDLGRVIKDAPAPAAEPQAVPSAAKTDVKKDITKALSPLRLPFDWSAKANVSALRYKGNKIKTLQFDGGMAQSQLSIAKLVVEDEAQNRVAVSGRVDDVFNLSGMELNTALSTADADVMIERYISPDMAETMPFKLGRTNATVDVSGSVDQAALRANLTARNLDFSVSGDLLNPLSALEMQNLRFAVSHPDYTKFVQIFAPEFNGSTTEKRAVFIGAQAEKAGDVITLSSLEAKVGRSDITGTVSVDLSKSRPDVTADLLSEQIILEHLLAQPVSATGTQSATTASAGRSAAATGDFKWSRNAIHTEPLFAVDADIKAKVGQFSNGTIKAENLDVAVNLNNGTLTVQKARGNLYDGAFQLNGKVVASQKERSPLAINGDITVSDINLERFVAAFAGRPIVRANGTVSGNASLSTTGLSVAAMIFDLSGKGDVNGKQVTIEGMDLTKLAKALTSFSSSWSSNISGLLDATLSGGSTAFDTVEGNFTIKEGVVDIEKMNFLNPSVGLNFNGLVDLPQWKVNAESNVVLAEEGSDPVTFTIPVQGSLSNPAADVPRNVISKLIAERIGEDLINPLLDKLIEKKAPRGATGTSPSTGGTTTNDGASRQQRQPTTEEAIFGVIEGLF